MAKQKRKLVLWFNILLCTGAVFLPGCATLVSPDNCADHAAACARLMAAAGSGSIYMQGPFGADFESGLGPLSSDEELWVIATPSLEQSGPSYEDSPGTGAMLARVASRAEEASEPGKTVPLPLQHTDVYAQIDGYISTVDVQQTFANPFDTKIEATYLFPLPEKAAVSEFVMTIGERKIRGILRPKEEAQHIYAAARAQGYRASLLVQHRPNIFEQKVANIEPGKSIDVEVRYLHTLAYDDGWYAFVFPTVVGPRYNPPNHKEPVAAVARGVASQGTTAVPYLAPGERSAHDIDISVDINAGVAIEAIDSTQTIETSRPTLSTASVQLAKTASMPNQDFVLRFQVAGAQAKSSYMTSVDPESGNGYFTMMLYPPADSASLPRQPMEMVFVLDTSGSMKGNPLQQAKAAVASALDQLQPGDSFQIVRFSDDTSQLGAAPLPVSKESLQQAKEYLRRLKGSGGTQMIAGIKAALDFPHDPERLRFVSFMTDGYIGNERDIIAAVHERIGAARIFSFGVGSSVNRYLLERMARVGRGAVAYLGPKDSGSAIMSAFFARISHPALTDIEIDWGGMAVSDMYPAKLPDMFVGRAIVVTGKVQGAAQPIRVMGISGGMRREIIVQHAPGAAAAHALPKIWARLRIAELADRQAWEPDGAAELGSQIRDTALQHQLVSDYTSFVAVDTAYQTEGEFGVTVPQAVPVPAGVRYDTTVAEP